MQAVYVFKQVDNKKIIHFKVYINENDKSHDFYEKVACALGRTYGSIINPLWWLSKNGVKYITREKDYEYIG